MTTNPSATERAVEAAAIAIQSDSRIDTEDDALVDLLAALAIAAAKEELTRCPCNGTGEVADETYTGPHDKRFIKRCGCNGTGTIPTTWDFGPDEVVVWEPAGVVDAMRASGWSESEIGAAMDGRYSGTPLAEKPTPKSLYTRKVVQG